MRLRERYGNHFTRGDLDTMVKRIRQPEHHRHNGKAVFAGRESNRTSRWFVWHLERWFPVIYDKKSHRIATVLPEGAFGTCPKPFLKNPLCSPNNPTRDWRKTLRQTVTAA